MLQQIWPDVSSCECVNIIHRGTFIPGLALCPAQLSTAHTLSQTLSLDYHQRSCWPRPTSLCPRSLLALWKQRGERWRWWWWWWGSDWPIFMCQFGTQRETLCVDTSWSCQLLWACWSSFWDESSAPQTSVSCSYLRVPPRTTTQSMTLTHDPWVTTPGEIDGAVVWSWTNYETVGPWAWMTPKSCATYNPTLFFPAFWSLQNHP